MTSQIAVLPLPFVTFALAVLAGALCLRHNFGPERARFYFAAFFGAVALGSLLAGLRFGYGFDQVIVVQRVLPLFVGPLLFLGFVSLAMPAEAENRLQFLHLGAASAAALLSLWLGEWSQIADWLIAISYTMYAMLLARMWWRGANGMVCAPLENAGRIANWAGIAAAYLLLSLVFDTAIAASFAFDKSGTAVLLISAGAIIMTLMLISVVTYAMTRGTVSSRTTPRTVAAAGRDHTATLAAAEELMSREALYLDTGLTADRLAKRLRLPVRALSEAINQNLGVSISQYVNGFRLQRAAVLLATTDLEMAQIMAQSGFLSRSNFYREFQREYGQTPVAYRKKEAAERANQGR